VQLGVDYVDAIALSLSLIGLTGRGPWGAYKAKPGFGRLVAVKVRQEENGRVVGAVMKYLDMAGGCMIGTLDILMW
jgi:hypothetical protein